MEENTNTEYLMDKEPQYQISCEQRGNKYTAFL